MGARATLDRLTGPRPSWSPSLPPAPPSAGLSREVLMMPPCPWRTVTTKTCPRRPKPYVCAQELSRRLPSGAATVFAENSITASLSHKSAFLPDCPQAVGATFPSSLEVKPTRTRVHVPAGERAELARRCAPLCGDHRLPAVPPEDMCCHFGFSACCLADNNGF